MNTSNGIDVMRCGVPINFVDRNKWANIISQIEFTQKLELIKFFCCWINSALFYYEFYSYGAPSASKRVCVSAWIDMSAPDEMSIFIEILIEFWNCVPTCARARMRCARVCA